MKKENKQMNKELKTACGCVCHDLKHKGGLIHDSACCDRLQGSLEYWAVKNLLLSHAKEVKARERERIYSLLIGSMPSDAENLSTLTGDQAQKTIRNFLQYE